MQFQSSALLTLGHLDARTIVDEGQLLPSSLKISTLAVSSLALYQQDTMGNALSQLRLAVREFASVLASYKELSRKLQRSPGLPHANPTLPFWTVPASRLSKHLSSEQLPDYADIVIIGSGITGTSVARTLLLEGDPKLKVVMLEARETCSGATGRSDHSFSTSGST